VRRTQSTASSAFADFRFPREVITLVVRWYLRYGLSCRDVSRALHIRIEGRPHRYAAFVAIHDQDSMKTRRELQVR
jgi:hypothetical protein